MIKNTLPDKSGNSESLKKWSQQFESFSTNVPIVGKDFLRAFYRLFYLQFCDSNDQWKNTVAKVLLAIGKIFLNKNNLTIIPTDLVTNWLLFSFCPFLQTKNKNQVLISWWSCNEKYFCSLFIASLALLQSHVEFNRLL